MKETAPDETFSPEIKAELKEAFELFGLFAEKSPEEFMEILKSRQEKKKRKPKE